MNRASSSRVAAVLAAIALSVLAIPKGASAQSSQSAAPPIGDLEYGALRARANAAEIHVRKSRAAYQEAGRSVGPSRQRRASNGSNFAQVHAR